MSDLYANVLGQRPNSPNRGNSISRKYYMTCQDRITAEHPTTNDWLTVEELLKKPDARDLSRVLKGVLDKKKEVVVKLSDRQTLEKEYQIAKGLHNIPGFMHPICYFNCNGSFKEYPALLSTAHKRGLCDGPGLTLGILVMPYFPMNSILKHAWMPASYEALTSCLVQLVCSLVQAYEVKGLIHNDMHLDNVMIHRTSKKVIQYTIGGRTFHIPTYGLRITILDFELSLVESPPDRGVGIRFLYRDILNAITDLSRSRHILVSGRRELLTALEKCEENITGGLSQTLLRYLTCIIPLIGRLRFEQMRDATAKLVYNPSVFGGGLV